jgi:hypothetical protein
VYDVGILHEVLLKDADIVTRRTNLETYSLLRVIQASVIRLPSQQLQDSILFEGVLGRTRPLPYELFRHFEVSPLCCIGLKSESLRHGLDVRFISPY